VCDLEGWLPQSLAGIASKNRLQRLALRPVASALVAHQRKGVGRVTVCVIVEVACCFWMSRLHPCLSWPLSAFASSGCCWYHRVDALCYDCIEKSYEWIEFVRDQFFMIQLNLSYRQHKTQCITSACVFCSHMCPYSVSELLLHLCGAHHRSLSPCRHRSNAIQSNSGSEKKPRYSVQHSVKTNGGILFCLSPPPRNTQCPHIMMIWILTQKLSQLEIS